MEEKTEVKGFYKSGVGIINKDNAALLEYKAQKARNNKLNTMETKVNKIESDISEIKELLRGLVK